MENPDNLAVGYWISLGPTKAYPGWIAALERMSQGEVLGFYNQARYYGWAALNRTEENAGYRTY